MTCRTLQIQFPTQGEMEFLVTWQDRVHCIPFGTATTIQSQLGHVQALI